MNELDIRNNYLEHYKKENEMFDMPRLLKKLHQDCCKPKTTIFLFAII